MEKEKSEAMALPQLESLAAWGPGGEAGRLQVSAVPHAASSISVAPILTLKALQARCHIYRTHQPQ